jgi:hypothetical protein
MCADVSQWPEQQAESLSHDSPPAVQPPSVEGMTGEETFMSCSPPRPMSVLPLE